MQGQNSFFKLKAVIVTFTLLLIVLKSSILVGQTQITVSPGTKHQDMVGFGACISWYETWIYGGNNAKDDAINQTMFQDSGLDILRIKNWYYPGEGDDASAAAVAKAYADAKAINPNIQVLLSSWSPPVSLKSNGDRNNGGTLTSDGGGFMYDELAAYWVDLLTNMGWTPDYLSFQNEPGWTAGWESCLFNSTEGTNASYNTALDTIWNAIKDMPNCPKIVATDAENMGSFLSRAPSLEDKTYIDVNAYHTYDIGDTNAIDNAAIIQKMNQIRDDYNSRPNWVTEYSKEGMDWIGSARAIHNAMVEANASAYIYWKLTWDDASCTDTMLGLTSTNGSYTIRPHFYTVKHFAKYVDQGDKRIEVSGSTSDVKVSGYLATDQLSVTLVAINKSGSAQQISLNHAFTVSNLAGYQSVTDNYWQTMSGLNIANPIDLPANSLTTLVLTLPEVYNTAPVASDSSPETFVNQDLPLTLQAVDDDEDDLTYSVLSGPDHGQLTGTGANRTYSPDTDYTGTDTITFKVNDTKVDSNTATVTITVRPPNTPPSVEAGDPQTVTLPEVGGGSPVSGAYYEWDAANDTAGDSTWNSTTANTDRDWTFASAQTPADISDPRFTGLTKAYEFPTAIASASSFTGVGETESATFEFVLDTDTDNGIIFETGGSGSGVQFDMHGGDLRFHIQPGFTLSTTLSGTDKGRFIHVVGVIDITNSDLLLYLDGNLVDSNLSFTLNDWSGGNGSGLGKMESSTASEGATGGTEAGDFTGKIALFRYYRNKAFNSTEVTQNFDAVNAGQEITANLDATVSDVDGDEFTTTWTLQSGPVGETVTFNDPSLEDASATFYAPGTYVLRLTADDSFDTNYDEVTITVNPEGSNTLTVTNGTGDGVYTEGTEVAITADTPPVNNHFVNWTTSDGGSFADENASSTTYSMPANNATVTANYAIDTYTVTFDLDGKGTRTGGGALVQTIDHGSSASAPTVTPDAGYTFDSWDVAFDNVTSDITVTAEYSVITYTVTFVEGSHGSRTGGGALVQTIDHGLAATAPTITADTGYTFTGWDTPFDNVTSNLTVTAEYANDGTPHSADTNTDWSISQAEVNSFITAYSNNSNTVTTANGDITAGRITTREVMRVIYLYNDGGAYIGGQGTVDGYDIAGAQADPAPAKPEAQAAVDEGDGSLIVSSTADSGAGSLRDAIAVAADGETITIDASVGTITVLSEIIIDKSITIDGQGAAIVSGENQTRIFRIENEDRQIDVTLKNMGIVDAENSSDEFGGAIYNNGQTLTLDTVLLDGNKNTTSEGKGGAVYSSGTLNLDNCVFRNNSASEEDDVYQE